MEKYIKAPVEKTRVKTDRSLEDERNKTDTIIETKRSIAENEADKKTQLNRTEADTNLAQSRAADDLKIEDRPETNKEAIQIERDRSDEAQASARLDEDRVRNKERLQKSLIDEKFLESERKNTDSNLLNEREQNDIAHDETKVALITRDQFLAVVSHDLKNPLSSILLAANMMRINLSKSAKQDDGLNKYLTMIERNVANMDRLIEDLLDLERISNNKLFLIKDTNSIGDLLKECVDLLSPVAQSKKITLQMTPLSKDLSTALDSAKILQVLSNLIGNALKFCPEGSSITLSARSLKSEIEITVNDNGPGIREDKMAEIFERFSQLKSNDRRGLGLGLFISRWIVEAHDGKIRVHSKVGEGCTFCFTLPMSG